MGWGPSGHHPSWVGVAILGTVAAGGMGNVLGWPQAGGDRELSNVI